jgi:hypothetical protein
MEHTLNEVLIQQRMREEIREYLKKKPVALV